MGERIPALTIWQPWASLISAGAKPYEWRGGSYLDRRRYLNGPRVGERIAIHAAARKVRRDEIHDLLLTLRRGDDRLTSLHVDVALPLLERWASAPGMLPLSSVLCTAVIGQPITAAKYGRLYGCSPDDSDRIDHTRWGWPLTDIEVLEPFVPAKGMQGFWWWTAERG